MPFDENILVRCVGFIQDSDAPMGESTRLREILRPIDRIPIRYDGTTDRHTLDLVCKEDNEKLVDFMRHNIRHGVDQIGKFLANSIPKGSKQKVRLLLAVDIDPSAMHWDEPKPTLDEIESFVTFLASRERPIR